MKSSEDKNSVSQSKKIEKMIGKPMPKRLAHFFDSGEVDQYKDCLITGLYSFGSDEKMQIHFDSEFLPDYWEYGSDGYFGDVSDYFPFATLGDDGTFFLAVDTKNKKLPVLFFEYEEGYHPHSTDFDTFLKNLLGKGEKTKTESLADAYNKAKNLYKKKDYAGAADTLGPVLDVLKSNPAGDFMDHNHSIYPASFNLLGICLDHLERKEEASKSFMKAAELGSKNAKLNLASRFIDLKDYKSAVVTVEPLMWYPHRHPYKSIWFNARRYFGHASLMLGWEIRASDTYRTLIKVLSREKDGNAEQAEEIWEELHEFAAMESEVSKRAERIIASIEDERRLFTKGISIRRAWWEGLPPAIQEPLKKSAGIREDISDRDIKELLELQTLNLAHAGIESLDFLAPFTRLSSLTIDYNKVTKLDFPKSCWRLKFLSIGNNKVVSFAGIEPLLRLETLYASNLDAKSLDGIGGLPRLSSLNISSNGIKDLSPLAGCRSLQTLNISRNPVTDLSPLASCGNLREINTYNCDIEKGLMEISGLPLLKEVKPFEKMEDEARRAEFKSKRPDIKTGLDWKAPPAPKEEVEALLSLWKERENLPGPWKKLMEKLLLQSLQDHEKDEPVLKGTKMPSVQALSHVTKRTSLTLEKEVFENLMPVRVFGHLTLLKANGIGLTSCDGIESTRNLEKIELSNNHIASLLPIRGLTRLRSIICNNGDITSLKGIENLPVLDFIEFNGNKLVDIGPVTSLPCLQVLSIQENAITSIEPLAGSGLLELNINENKVTDLSPLASCMNLEVIECIGNPGISGLSSLAGLPRLGRVVSRGSIPAEERESFRNDRPDVEVD